MLQRIFGLLDNDWINRASNGAFLGGVVAWVISKVIGHVEWLTIVAVVCMAVGVIRLIFWAIERRRARTLNAALANDPMLGPMIYTAQKEERERLARQIARENVDRLDR